MNIINLDKEKEIAIKAAKLAGKLLKEDKNIGRWRVIAKATQKWL